MRKGKKMTLEQRQKLREAVRKAMSPEVRKKMSLAKKGKPSSWKGKHPSAESLKKMRESHLGQVAWNKGKTGVYSEETRGKMSLAKKGHVPWIKGKHHTFESRERMSAALKGRFAWNKGKKTGIAPWKGKKRSDETIKKLQKKIKELWNNPQYREKLIRIHKASPSPSEWKKGQHVSSKTEFKKGHGFSEEALRKMSESHRGEKSVLWKGGISFEPYSSDWTKALKILIRERDNYTCQICGKQQDKIGFDVHHIDYNKKNCNPENLITLCKNCHIKTSQNREKWTKFFRENSAARN